LSGHDKAVLEKEIVVNGVTCGAKGFVSPSGKMGVLTVVKLSLIF